MPATWRWLFERVESPLGGNQRRRGEEREREKKRPQRRKRQRGRAHSLSMFSLLYHLSQESTCVSVCTCVSKVFVYTYAKQSRLALSVCASIPPLLSPVVCVSRSLLFIQSIIKKTLCMIHTLTSFCQVYYSVSCVAAFLFRIFFFKKVSSSPTLRPGKQENASALQGSFPPFFPLKRNQ